MSTHAYTRTATDGLWDLYPGPLAVAIEAALPAKAFVVRATGTAVEAVFDDELSAGEITTLDASVEAARVAPNALALLKEKRKEEIDTRTNELITAGFQHAGKTFSLSQNAQIKWMGGYSLRAFFTAAAAYPLTVNTKDDMDTHDVADEAEMAVIWQTVGVSVLTILGGDTFLKGLVNAATTIAEVDAVVDSR
jgi:hypothetical protein